MPPTGGFLTVSSGSFAWGSGTREDATPSGGTWSKDFGPGGIDPVSMGSPVAYLTDSDGDIAESQAPDPVVWVDPAADRIWAIDFKPGPVTLTIHHGSAAPYSTTVNTTNVLTKGAWNIDMWATPTGSMSRPAVARYDLTGSFDITGGDLVDVTDGTTDITFGVADLTVDGITPTPGNTMSGHASGVDSVTLHLGDGEGGHWGYNAAVTGGAWAMYFDPTQFPNPPQGLTPGSLGQAIVSAPANAGGTEVRWTVPSTLTEASQIVPVVQALALPSKIDKQLVSSLTAAQRSYDSGRVTSGNRSMTSFIGKVGELRGNTIPMQSADELIADAQAVITAHS